MDRSPTPTDDTAGTDDDADTTFACPYCTRVFTDPELRALHMGWEHTDDLDATEHDAFEAAYERETEELRLFRLKLLFALVVLYFVVLFLFAIVT